MSRTRWNRCGQCECSLSRKWTCNVGKHGCPSSLLPLLCFEDFWSVLKIHKIHIPWEMFDPCTVSFKETQRVWVQTRLVSSTKCLAPYPSTAGSPVFNKQRRGQLLFHWKSSQWAHHPPWSWISLDGLPVMSGRSCNFCWKKTDSKMKATIKWTNACDDAHI